ncbi:hypothetical protein P5V15_004372 [Pogonomyrmex californicus]
MKAKTNIGMGMKAKTREKPSKINISDGETRPIVTDSANVGRAWILWIGGAASVAKAVNDRKAPRCQLEELQRHNRAMETREQELYLAPYKYGQGLYLAPYKRKRGAKKEKKEKNAKETIKVPTDITTNVHWASWRDVCAYRTSEVYSCVMRYRLVARVERSAMS